MAGKRSVRSVLIMQSVLVAAIPLLMVTLLSLRLLIEHTNNDLTIKNTQIAGTISASVGEFLHQATDELSHTAAVLSAKGPIDPEQTNQYLTSLTNVNLYFEKVQLVDERDKVLAIAPYRHSDIGIDLSSNAFVSEVRLSPGVHWSETFISPATGEPTVTIGLCHKNRVVLANLNLARISQFARKFKVGHSGFVEIVDKNGTYLAHPDRTKVAQREVDTALNKQVSAKGSFSTGGFSYSDEENLYNAVQIMGSDWAVVAVQPVWEAYQSLTTIRNTSIVVILIAIAVAFFVSIKNATFLSKHFRHLVKRTQAVAAGDYSEVVSKSKLIELNELASNFNSMTADIRNLIADLEEVEAGKTKFYRETILSVTDGKLEICEEADVAEYMDSELSAEVQMAETVTNARKLVENLCLSNGVEKNRTDEFVLGVGEAITNAIKHGGGGRMCGGHKDKSVWVAVIDRGPGLESIILPKAVLRRGFSTKPSMGMGYSIMLDVADRLYLSTNKEGTVVVLFKDILDPGLFPLENLPDTW